MNLDFPLRHTSVLTYSLVSWQIAYIHRFGVAVRPDSLLQHIMIEDQVCLGVPF